MEDTELAAKGNVMFKIRSANPVVAELPDTLIVYTISTNDGSVTRIV